MATQITVTFTLNDMPDDCQLTTDQFDQWLQNNGGQLRDHLITEGNEWILMHLEIDGHMEEEQSDNANDQ